MSESRGQMTPADFGTVLAVLQGWLGEPVELAIESPAAGFTVARVRGVLGGTADVGAPHDDAEFTFALGPDARFALRRDHFHAADLFPYDGRLLVALFDDPSEPEERVTTVLDLTGPPLGRPPARQ